MVESHASTRSRRRCVRVWFVLNCWGFSVFVVTMTQTDLYSIVYSVFVLSPPLQLQACGTNYCPYAYPKLRLYLRPKGYSAPAYGKSGPHMGPGIAAASPSLNSDGGLTHYHYSALSVDGALSSRNAHTSSSTGVVVGVVLGVVGVIAMAVVVVARRRTQTKEVQRQSAGTAPLTPSVGVPAPASL